MFPTIEIHISSSFVVGQGIVSRPVVGVIWAWCLHIRGGSVLYPSTTFYVELLFINLHGILVCTGIYPFSVAHVIEGEVNPCFTCSRSFGQLHLYSWYL